MRTRNLLAKTFCYQRQLAWGLQEGFGPLINPTIVQCLQSELRHRPPAELERAANDLGIRLDSINVC
jgi:hypothetical protein